jgi:hypothetical protein
VKQGDIEVVKLIPNTKKARLGLAAAAVAIVGAAAGVGIWTYSKAPNNSATFVAIQTGDQKELGGICTGGDIARCTAIPLTSSTGDVPKSGATGSTVRCQASGGCSYEIDVDGADPADSSFGGLAAWVNDAEVVHHDGSKKDTPDESAGAETTGTLKSGEQATFSARATGQWSAVTIRVDLEGLT